MDQIGVYGFCILAALILAGMMIRFRSMTKAWAKQKRTLENSMQDMKELQDILRIDIKCLLKDQEETIMHLQDSFFHVKEIADRINHQKNERVQEILHQEETLGDIRSKMQVLKNKVGILTETTADVLLKTEKLERCSQSASGVYREFLEKNQIRMKASDYAQKQADIIINLASEFQNQAQLVRNLAEQIELLSLNANIEAAKNEERENGFSVIALEMRKLSEESRELSEMFARKNKMIFECVQQNKDNMDYMAQLQESEQNKITKTGFLLEQLWQETQRVTQAAETLSSDIEGLETEKRRVLELLENLPFVDSRNQEETALEELQNILERTKEDGCSLMKLTEEMQIRLTE